MSNKGLHKNELGSGIYTASDISRILALPLPKVSRYLNKYWNTPIGKHLFKDTYSWSISNRIRAVNFYVLIELYTFIKLNEMGVSVQKTFKIRKQIGQDLGSEYPFASAGILCDGKNVWYELEENIINPDGTRQTNLRTVITQFAKRIDFNNKSHLAERFYPAGKSKSIVVDPHHQFGLPVIKGTNINTETIYSMFYSGEPIERIAFLYQISVKDVKDTIKFCKAAA